MTIHPDHHVAIIGAGPGGLAAAAWLRRQGFTPVLFEAAERPGGQWNAGSAMSGVWPGMRTNTSRVLTAFSDLDHGPGTAVYPTAVEMQAYLERYAAMTGSAGAVRTSTRVDRLVRAEGGRWAITSRRGGETAVTEVFARVVVATGRQNTPVRPAIAGLESFGGAGGVIHAFDYNGAEAYRGQKVLVAGCSISALEIASDLAMAGAAGVTLASRRQRYVLQKLLAGVPADHLAFTRWAALAGEVLPPAALAAGMKDFVLKTSGSPEQFGAPRPHDDLFAAGLTQSQHYLPLVAEGRIRPRPWIAAIDRRCVTFADGQVEDIDAIVLATGYRLALPFIDPPDAATLGIGDGDINLADHTFHPDIAGLAFLGLYDQIGPQLPVLELQARWIAYGWAGKAPLPDRSGLRHGGSVPVTMHDMAVLFARRAGVEPMLAEWPELQRALLFGPLSPVSFRLSGPDALADAPARVAAAAAAFGAIGGPEMTVDEAARWQMVRDARLQAA